MLRPFVPDVREARRAELLILIPEVQVLVPKVLVFIPEVLVLRTGNHVRTGIVRDARGRELNLSGREKTEEEIQGHLHRITFAYHEFSQIREGNAGGLRKLGEGGTSLVSLPNGCNNIV